MSSDEETKAVQIMLDAAKDTEYLEDAMLLGYRALKEYKYPKPPEIDMSKLHTRTVRFSPETGYWYGEYAHVPQSHMDEIADAQMQYGTRMRSLYEGNPFEHITVGSGQSVGSPVVGRGQLEDLPF